MATACPVLSPEERKASEILDRAQRTMMEKVHATVAKAAEQCATMSSSPASITRLLADTDTLFPSTSKRGPGGRLRTTGPDRGSGPSASASAS